MSKLLATIHFLALIIYCSASSCQVNVNSKVEGFWTIDKITYGGENVRDYLLSNILIFDKKGLCTLPVTHDINIDTGNWYVHEVDGRVFLILQSTNEIFDGEYEVVFWKDNKKKLLKMSLKSNTSTLKLECSKLLNRFSSVASLLENCPFVE